MFYVRNPWKEWQIKINQDSGHFSGYHINIIASLAEHLGLCEYKRFTRRVWVTSVKWKSASKIQDIFYIENDIYRVLHERSNIAAFSVEHQKFPERKKKISSGMWVASDKLK